MKVAAETQKNKSSRTPEVDFHINERTITEAGLPTDYSYVQMKHLEGCLLSIVSDRFETVTDRIFIV